MAGPTTPQGEARTHAAQLNARFERARRAVIGTRLLDMRPDQLRGMEARLSESQEAATEAMEGLQHELGVAIEAHNWQRVEALRMRTVDQTRSFEALRELAVKVRNARMERELQDALVARLGSVRRRVIYDALVMAVIFLVLAVLCAQEFGDLSERTMVLFDWIDFAACCVLMSDFFWRMRLTSSRRWFWRHYWLDFVTSIPVPSLHALRLGRTVRLVRMLRLLRLARLLRIALYFWRGMDKLAAAFDVRLMRRSLGILALVLVLGSLGILYAEAGSDADGVRSLGQSLWWSFTTVVTGGFGDIHNPESVTGRLLTVGLVIAGMVVVGIFTATLTSLLVRENDESEAILSLEERVLREIGELREELCQRLPAPPAEP